MPRFLGITLLILVTTGFLLWFAFHALTFYAIKYKIEHLCDQVEKEQCEEVKCVWYYKTTAIGDVDAHCFKYF